MPIHDWTRTYAGAFHAFHLAWIAELQRALNAGLLPRGYYALGEQVVGGAVPDVLAPDRRGAAGTASGGAPLEAEAAAASAYPTATITAVAEAPRYPPRPRVVAVRHRSGDRLVALIDIVSPGNQSDAAEVGALVEKTVVALSKRIHVLLIDLHPPGSFDPLGLHNLVWAELDQAPVKVPVDRPLAFVSYLARGRVESFIEPRAVGERLPDMPLFLGPALHVTVPLEATYGAAFASLPAHLREELERPL
ncbi:MAG: DUF4058 domain-containing protein [Planctomycetes bacterium]|nr:DUF4058 domain-containing protein [Planctomycetota bacterium]